MAAEVLQGPVMLLGHQLIVEAALVATVPDLQLKTAPLVLVEDHKLPTHALVITENGIRRKCFLLFLPILNKEICSICLLIVSPCSGGITYELRCGQGTTANRIQNQPCFSQKQCADICSADPKCQSCDWNEAGNMCATFSEYIPVSGN